MVRGQSHYVKMVPNEPYCIQFRVNLSGNSEIQGKEVFRTKLIVITLHIHSPVSIKF